MIISDSGRKPFTSHNIRGLPDWQSDQLTNRTEPFLKWDLDMKVENAHKSHTNSITLLLWSLQHKVRYPPEHKKRKKEKNGYMNGSAAMYSARLKWRYTANNIHVAMARHDGILSQQGLSMADTFHRRSVGMASLLSRRWGKAVTSFRLQDTRISRRIKVSLLGSWHQEVTQGTLTPFLKQRAEDPASAFPDWGSKDEIGLLARKSVRCTYESSVPFNICKILFSWPSTRNLKPTTLMQDLHSIRIDLCFGFRVLHGVQVELGLIKAETMRYAPPPTVWNALRAVIDQGWACKDLLIRESVSEGLKLEHLLTFAIHINELPESLDYKEDYLF